MGKLMVFKLNIKSSINVFSKSRGFIVNFVDEILNVKRLMIFFFLDIPQRQLHDSKQHL